jgi:hypothetical protein
MWVRELFQEENNDHSELTGATIHGGRIPARGTYFSSGIGSGRGYYSISSLENLVILNRYITGSS